MTGDRDLGDSRMVRCSAQRPARRPRFRRSDKPPPFRLTDGDIEIVRLLARHRFLRSTHIAALVDRSHDRVNKRLSRLFHAGYVDRPRAQLETYPTEGSVPMAYAIADRGARLLTEHNGTALINRERSRNNARVRRPFIKHQLEVMDFYVALVTAARVRDDVRFMPPQELVAGFSEPPSDARSPFAMRVNLSHNGRMHQVGLVPDLVFGLMYPDSSKRCFMVEIDRGTMPVRRSDIHQTSLERKVRGYLAVHASGLHQRQFGWKTFRTLIVVSDQNRMRSIIAASNKLYIPDSPGSTLFLFACRCDLNRNNPITDQWFAENGRTSRLL